jgi:hypothetical protein
MLEIVDISTGADDIIVGTLGDDKSTVIHFIMDGDVSAYDVMYAEFDVNVPDPTKTTYIKPALELDANYNVVLPAYIMSNVLRKQLPMQLSLENTEAEVRVVSLNTLMFRVADAFDTDHTPYNVIVPEPVTTQAGVFTAVVGDGVNYEFSLPHNLGTYNIGVLAYRNEDHSSVDVSWEMANADTATVLFDEPPSMNEMTVVVFRAGNGIYGDHVFQVSNKEDLVNLIHAEAGDIAYVVPDGGDTEAYILTDFNEGGYANPANWLQIYTSDTVDYSPTEASDRVLPGPEVTIQ